MLNRFFSARNPALPLEGINSNKIKKDSNVIRELNRILTACGVTRFLSSTKMYQKPSFIHVIVLEDLKLICEHRTLLLRSKEITCDFRSLSVILWSMLQDGDRVLNELLHGGRAVGCRSSSVDQWWNETTFTVKEKQNILSTLERTSYVAIALTTLLFPNARNEIAENVVVGAEDVERTISLAEKLNQLYLNIASAIEGSMTHTSKTGTIPQYDAFTHSLFIQVESCYLHVQELLVELPRRSVTDVEIILKEMYRPEVWEASGLSLRSTTCFTMSLRQLIISTAHRRRDIGGLSAAFARIVQNRLLRRPPYRHHPFRLSYQRTEANPMNTKDFFFLDPTFGLLKQFWAVKIGLEQILCPGSLCFPVALKKMEAVVLSPEEKNALREVSRATRFSFLAQAKKIQTEGKRLSYHQLIGYALFEGMPGTDLNALGEMILRAQSTNLIAMDASMPFISDPKYKWGEFLRLLTAVCFTVRTDAGVGILSGEGRVTHDPIPLPSVVPLLNSLAEFVFQERQFQQQASMPRDLKDGKAKFPFCSPFSTLDSLHIHPILNLISSHEDLIHVGRVNSEKPASHEALSVVHELQLRLESLVTTLYSACARVQQEFIIKGRNVTLKTLEERIPPLAFARYKDIIEVSAVVLRRGIQVAAVQAVFPHSLLSHVLDTATRLFAVYNLQIIKFGPSKDQEKTLKLFEGLLRFIPSVMKVQDVNDFFVGRLVPLVKPILQSSTFDEEIVYSRLEGYLKAFSTATAAYVITDENFLEHWSAVGVACMTKISDDKHMSVVKAAHDFYIAAFLSKRCLAPLLMPTFLAVIIPVKWNGSKYRIPKLELVKHFAASLRYACQCVIECDGEKLRCQIEDPTSVLRQMVSKNQFIFEGSSLPVVPIPSSAAPEADGSSPPTVTSPLQRITPTNVVLLVVSSLFDQICRLLHVITATSAPNTVRRFSISDLMQLFIVFFSALTNQLQIANVEVFPRVCASLEAVLLEHMKELNNLRSPSLKYVGVVVSQTKGPLKKDAAEWYLNLSQKMHKEKMVSKL